MHNSHSKEIIQLLSDEQLNDACKNGLCIVRVSCNTESIPITLASKEKLSNGEYIDYVQSIGIIADNYDIRGIFKNE